MIGRRKTKRFQLKSCRIKISKSSIFGLKTKKNLQKVVLVNLSVAGLQVLTTDKLNPGDKYNLKIITNVFPPMEIASKVIWCKLYKTKNMETYHQAGLKFYKVPGDFMVNLKRLEQDPLLREVKRTIL